MEFMREGQEIEKLRTDKFYQLEHSKEDKIKGDNQKSRLNEIIEYQVKYELNWLLKTI
jgi:hypothetical protein